MPRVGNVKLNVDAIASTSATLSVEWTINFYAKEIAANQVFDCVVFLQNEDGTGDLDIRRRVIGQTWIVAKNSPVTQKVKMAVDRSFLNEDFEIIGGFGDTTDEWHAEVVVSPYTPASKTLGRSNTIRQEFGP